MWLPANKTGFSILTMFRVIKRPKAVTRKLVSENWFLSRGKYHGRGESTAASSFHMTFTQINKTSNECFSQNCTIDFVFRSSNKEISERWNHHNHASHLKACKFQGFKTLSQWSDVRKSIAKLNFTLSQWI